MEEINTLFIHLALIMFVGALFGNLFKRINVPPVLGEVLAGVVLGPSLLGLVELSETIKVLAELGVVLLLFEVGLEADIYTLMRVGFWSFVVANIGAFLPLVFGFLVSKYFFNLPTTTSLFIGGALTATSIGITVRVLTDLRREKERFAQIVLGAAVLDDILGVVILAGLYEFSKENSLNLSSILNLIFHISLFFLIAPIVAKATAKLLLILSEKLKELEIIPPVVFSLILLFGYGAHKVGSPAILGSFTAGLALSRNFELPYLRFLSVDERLVLKIEEKILPLVYVIAPIFFVSVGLALNLKSIDFGSLRFWLLSLSLIVVAIFGKVLSGFFVKGSIREKLAVGFSMLPRGEVGLIFAEFGRSFKVINEEEYAVVVFVVAVTTLLAPILIKITLRR